MFFDDMNLAILIGSVLVVAAAFTSLLSFRFGAPLLLVFLLVGLIAGEDGIGIPFNDLGAAYFIGAMALAIILFDAGYATRLATLRLAAAPALVLATAGVLITAVIVGVAAQYLFGFSFLQGLLLGVIVASTDAAAVFFLLNVGGLTLRDLVRSTLEIESGTNDPIAIFLTIAIVGLLDPAGAGVVGWALFGELIAQIAVGLAGGVLGGMAIIQIVRRTRFEPALFPIIVMAVALAAFALTSRLYGSGFLAVYVAGLMAGNARLPHAAAVARFQAAATWLAQIAMFVTLGLLATPSEFPAVALSALVLAVFLMVVARPVAVWLCLLPFRFTRHEMAFVSWVGLRGAVSILLAVVPVLSDVPGGRVMFNTAFVVVLASLLVQGWSIAPVARFLGVAVPPRQGPVDRIELELPGRGNHEIVAYVVHPDSPVARGERIPRWARPSLVVRDGRTLRPHRFGRPQAGDQIYVITTPEYIALLDKLFAGQTQGGDDPDLYGEFAIDPDARLVEIAQVYPAAIAVGDENLSARDFLRRQLAGDIETGDRVPLGPVDLIVRRVSATHEIEEVGLAMEHAEEARPHIPIFQNPRELGDLARDWLKRMRRVARAAVRSFPGSPRLKLPRSDKGARPTADAKPGRSPAETKATAPGPTTPDGEGDR
jgi:cell volume regulation protein A